MAAMLDAEAMFTEINTFIIQNNLISQNPSHAIVTVDASREEDVGGNNMLQTHQDSVHVEGIDSPSVCPEQDAAVDFDSMKSGGQASISYVKTKQDRKQPKICYPLELNEKSNVFPLKDCILTRTVFVNESLPQQELQQQNVSVAPIVSRSTPSGSKSGIPEENDVFQMLLRRCRYFDYRNGSSYVEDNDVNPPTQKFRKPCYVCGQFLHIGKKCPKRRICCTCKKRGHIAEDCPMNNKEYDICLRCGESGHDLSTCNGVYSPDDLQNIQCYVCNELGHMCCGDYTYLNPETASCYNCGESGHPGLQCPKPLLDKCGSQPPSICYKCGDGGHAARKCTKDEGLSGCHTRGQASDLGEEGDENRKKARRSKAYRQSRRKQKMRGLLEYKTVSYCHDV